MRTKKFLVAFDSQNPSRKSSDFLVVLLEGQQPRFIGIKSKKAATSGRMVYIGKEIDANDLFAALVKEGHKIENVEEVQDALGTYIQSLQDFRIGNILGVEADAKIGFKLTKLFDMQPVSAYSKLP